MLAGELQLNLGSTQLSELAVPEISGRPVWLFSCLLLLQSARRPWLGRLSLCH